MAEKMEVMEKKCAMLARQTAAMARLLSGCRGGVDDAAGEDDAAADAVAVEVAIVRPSSEESSVTIPFRRDQRVRVSIAKSQPAAAFCTLRDAKKT